MYVLDSRRITPQRSLGMIDTLPITQTQRSRDRLLAVSVVASFLVCYAGVCASLVHQWLTNDVYAHGFLIPLISGYLIYERRTTLAQTAIVPDRTGGSFLLGGGLLLLLIGHVGGLIALAQLSLLVSAGGVVLLLLGRSVLTQVRLALIYLLFMIPVWELATNAFQGSFQLLSADIGTALLRAVAIPVRREGIYLELPNVTLHVAEACSGVNFVVAILAVTIPLAYLRLTNPSLRVFVALFAVVVALLTNGLRVALIGALSYVGNSGPDIHGPGHALQGLSVGVMGFFIMFATVHLLARCSACTETAPRPTESTPARFAAGRMVPRLAITTSLVLAAMAGLQTVSFATPVELVAPVTSFPANLGRWRTGPPNTASRAPRVAGVDSELSRTYVSAAGHAVELYAGYFSYQVQAKELVSDRMSTLHQNAQLVSVTRPDGAVFRANESESGRRYVLFWYEINGRTVTNRYAAKAWTIWDSLSRRRSNGAVVMLTADLSDSGDSSEVIQETREMGGLASLALQTYLPR